MKTPHPTYLTSPHLVKKKNWSRSERKKVRTGMVGFRMKMKVKRIINRRVLTVSLFLPLAASSLRCIFVIFSFPRPSLLFFMRAKASTSLCASTFFTFSAMLPVTLPYPTLVSRSICMQSRVIVLTSNKLLSTPPCLSGDDPCSGCVDDTSLCPLMVSKLPSAAAL
jgi:hypothetical protein